MSRITHLNDNHRGDDGFELNADDLDISDVADYFVGLTIESALAELGSNTLIRSGGALLYGLNGSNARLSIGASNTHLISDGVGPKWVANTGGGVTAHSALTGLTTGDDHTQYLLETLIDAGGDLLVGTAADTAGRLAIGASNTHLVSDGASASWRVDTDWISKTLIDAAGDLILGLTNDNPGRLGIGGSNTHLVSDGVTASWQSQPVASGGSAAKASGTGDVTTTGSLQDLTGSSLSLGAGSYIVAGSFDVLVNNAANDKTFEGHLDVGGADENDVAIFVALALVNDRFTVTQHWLVTFAATTTVKLRAQHSGGTLGDFTVKGANTTITAWVSGGGGGSSLTDHTHAITGSGATGGGGSLAPTALILPTSLGTTAGQVDWDATNYVAEVYDSQRERAVSASGWGNILYPAGYSPSAALTTSLTLAANGGSVALWVPNPGHALVGDIAVRSLDTGTARSWRWDIYVEDLNNGNAGENTVRRIAQSNGSESFTPGAASTRFLDPNAGEPYLPPGWLILVIQNTHATSTFALGSTAASTFGTAINSARTKTTTNPNGATLDLIAATWTNNTSIIAAIIRGAPLGQTAAL